MRISSLAVSLGCSLALGAALLATPAPAQNIDGIINLMGQAIQHDIQRQHYQRQRVYEDQQQRAAQRARSQQEKAARQQEANRRQAEVNAAREQAAAPIKRAQTALADLGFYTGKIDGSRSPAMRKAEAAYCKAFGLSGFEATDRDIQQLEQYAAKGFRGVAETERAARGNFSNRADMVAAEAGGFDNARDFTEARDKGFTRREEYLLFRQSGLSDRDEFLVAQARLARGKDASAACVTATVKFSDPVKSVELCLKAIELDASDTALKDAFAQIGEKLAARLAKLESGAPIAPQQVAALGDVKLKDAARPPKGAPNGPKAGAMLTERFQITGALKAFACGAAMLAKEYEAAAQKCKAESGDVLTEAQLALLSTATEKAEAAAANTQAEQERLALHAAKARAGELLQQVEQYAAKQKKFAAPVDVAKAVVAIRQNQSGSDAALIQQANQQLDAQLAKEAGFQAFLVERKNADEAMQVNANATAASELARLQAFLQQYIGDNILDKNIKPLLELQAELAAAQSPNDFERTIRMQKEGRDRLYALGLKAQFDGYKVPVASSEIARNTTVATNGLAVNALNKTILEGEARDVLVLGNYTRNAPHLVVNLLGETVFDGRVATVCWYAHEGAASESSRAAFLKLKSLGADEIIERKSCDANALMNVDVVLLQRGSFLSSDVAAARRLVEAVEQTQLRLLHTASWKEVGATSERDAEQSRAIETDVLAGVRPGFGLIAFANPSNRVCLIVVDAEQPVHEAALLDARNGIDRFVKAGATVTVTTVDRAFVYVQREECSAVYSRQDDMKTLIEGLKRVKLSYAVLPIWIGTDGVAEASALVSRQETAQHVALAARQQENEAAERLTAAKENEEGKVRTRQQMQLRDRYGQEAAAAANGLSDLGKQFFQATPTDQGQFKRLFPIAAQWRDEKYRDHWEVETYDGILLDYGTAEWKGRRAEVVFVRLSVRSKNRALGEYADDCFMVGYLIDAEFSILRDPVEASCMESPGVLSQWKAGRGFESRWIVGAR